MLGTISTRVFSVWVPIPAIFVYIQPWAHGFYCSDITIRYPFHKGTVSSTMLYTVGAALPTILVCMSYLIHVTDILHHYYKILT